MRFLPIYLFCVLLSSNVSALDCRKDIFENINFTICKTSLFEDDLRLYLNNSNGVPFGNFYALQKELNDKGKELLFAMNAGMYHSDLSPVGHYIEKLSKKKNVIAKPGPGNFGMLPNGIFCIGSDMLNIYETLEYLQNTPKCTYATHPGQCLFGTANYIPVF